MKYSKTSCLTEKNKIKVLYVTGVLFLLAALSAGITLGGTPLAFNEIKLVFTQGANYSAGTKIFAYVRLPRTVASIICGAALSVSGAVIQKVLANSLASPGIIGVNSGAGLAVTLCTALGVYSGWHISAFAFVGAFCTVMLINLVSKKRNSSRSTVILMGVALNSLLGAISDTVITFIPEVGVMSNNFKIGEFSAVTYQALIPAVILILPTFALLLTLTNELDVLTLGEESAMSLGMNTSVMRIVFLTLTALLAGCAVGIAGLLSFVGLIVPHAVRRFSGNRASNLLGLCALFGGSFVCLCDTAARTLFFPYEIPVGIIMAFLGAPFFISILIKGRERT